MEVSTTVTVDVLDDAPVFADMVDPDTTLGWEGGATGAYTTESGSLTLESGADGLKEGSLQVTDDAGKSARFDAEGKAIITYEDGSKLEARYDASTGKIEYTYTPGATTQVPNRDFTFSAQDTDGDPTSATVNVEVDLADSGDVPVPGQSITVDESGLADGTTPNADLITKSITLPEGYTLNTDGWVAGEDGALTLTVNEGKGLLTYRDGKLTYTLQDNYAHADATNPNEGLSDKPTFDLNLTHDVTGVEVSTTVTVDVLDDAPEITVTAGNPERGEQTNLTDGTLTSFENYDDSIWHAIEDKHSATICNGQVTMTAGIIYKWQPNTFVDDPNATFDKGFEDHPNLKDLSHGITVNGGIQDYPLWGTGSTDEIAANAYHSEAVQFTLNGLAYGLNLQLGAFFSAGADDPANEIVRVIFYRGDNIVEDITLDSTSVDGVFGKKGEFSQYFAEGFDRVVITAVDNGNSENNSEFVISNIGFVTQPNAMYVTSGTVTAVSGADGFDHAYDGNPHTEFAQADGTAYENGQQLTLYDAQGEPFTVTLEIKEGTSGGDKVMTAYRTENGVADSSQPVFSVNLDQDGNWTFKQYETFHDSPQSNDNTFELGFVTEDADGDRAFDSESIHLNTGTYGAVAGTADNRDDTIVITGGDGVAGTVAAGDSGGMTEGQQVAANYNVCFILDMSTSMTKNQIGGSGSDSELNRLQAAELSIQNFIGSIAGNTEFTDGSVTAAVIPFAEKAANPIEITITKESGETTYSYKDQTWSLDDVSKQLVSAIDKADVGGKFVTDYGPAFSEAASWYNQLGDSVESATGNITYFLTDGRPARYGTDDADKDDYERAWEGYQELLAAQGDGHIDIHAIGFGKDLLETDMENLAMFDNTAQAVGDAHVANGHFNASNGMYTPVTYEHPASIDHNETYYVDIDGRLQEVTYSSQYTAWGYYSWCGWKNVAEADLLERVIVPITGGTSQQVTDTGSLTAAFTSGFNPGALVAAGSDTITAAKSTSSGIVYGDVMNTDRLLYELKQLEQSNSWVMVGAVALPNYGSGTQVFQWLEANGEKLTGTDYAGWTHADTVDYMLRHADELGYETRVDDTGEFYLVKPDGTVLDMDGTEATVGLDSLTGRGGGDDTITGSKADDVIYGQEGDDLLVGDTPSGSGEGSTVDSIEGTTVTSIKEMDSNALDAFIESVEGTDADGDDRLFGGTGDDVLLGMGGDDYIDGGAGEDAIFGGRGNDIIVYDKADYLVSGGSGIDFMVSDDSELTLDTLLSGGKNGHEGPIVDSIEVLITGKDALSLTSLEQMAEKYGISINGSKLELDGDLWTQEDNGYRFTGDPDNGSTPDELFMQVNNDTDAQVSVELVQSDDIAEAVQRAEIEHSNG